MYNDKFISTYIAPPCFELAGKSFTLHLGEKTVRELKIGENTIQLNGETFDCTCTKCAENVYLIGFGSGTILLDTAAGHAALAFADQLSFGGLTSNETAFAVTDELSGWKASLILEPGRSVSCEFSKSRIRIEGEELDAEYRKIGNTMFLVSACASDGRLVLVIDTARFLFYGFFAGKTGLGGYIESVSTENDPIENISE